MQQSQQAMEGLESHWVSGAAYHSAESVVKGLLTPQQVSRKCSGTGRMYRQLTLIPISSSGSDEELSEDDQPIIVLLSRKRKRL